jgi:hypothetical protein
MIQDTFLYIDAISKDVGDGVHNRGNEFRGGEKSMALILNVNQDARRIRVRSILADQNIQAVNFANLPTRPPVIFGDIDRHSSLRG